MINLYFWEHPFLKIIKDKTLVDLLNKADIFIEEHECYYGSREEYLREQEEARMEISCFSRSPSKKYDLFDFLSGSKKLWFIEHTPISDEEAGEVQRLKRESVYEFCRGNLDNASNIRSKFFRSRADMGKKRDDNFSEQLRETQQKYPSKEILTTRGNLHSSYLLSKLDEKGVIYRAFYEPGSSPTELNSMVLLLYIEDKPVDNLTILRTIVEELLVGGYVVVTREFSPSKRVWERARSIAEKLDITQIKSLSDYMGKGVTNHTWREFISEILAEHRSSTNY